VGTIGSTPPGVFSDSAAGTVLQIFRPIDRAALSLRPSLQLVEIVSPVLHHFPPLGEVLRVVVGGADPVAFVMGKLAFDPIGMEPHFVFRTTRAPRPRAYSLLISGRCAFAPFGLPTGRYRASAASLRRHARRAHPRATRSDKLRGQGSSAAHDSDRPYASIARHPG
jgi:hypothetical protein